MKERLKEIVSDLDVDIYWKECNFLIDDSLDEGEVRFYSRDKCRNITFRELLLWYLPQLGQWQDSPNCSECDKNYSCTECEAGKLDTEVKQRHNNLFLELVDIYAFYSSQDYKKYNDLKDKLIELVNE